MAKRLEAEIPNAHILDQYTNPSNPLAHYDGTAAEIIAQCGGKVDAIVMSVGTGGTISGCARRFREELPDCEIVGVDPFGSILALPNNVNETKITGYQVEGIGYDFIPRVLERRLIDSWVKTEDKESFLMARRLIKEEGLLCGGSSGATMVGALEVCKRYGPGKRVVVLFADSVRNYMTKFLSDDWMIEHNFMPDNTLVPTEWWHSRNMADLKLSAPVTVSPDLTCTQVIEILANQGYDQLPVVDQNNRVLGMVSTGSLTSKLGSGKIQGNSPVGGAVFSQYAKVDNTTTLQKLNRIFETDHYALVMASHKRFIGPEELETTDVVVGVATRIDLVQYISNQKPESAE